MSSRSTIAWVALDTVSLPISPRHRPSWLSDRSKSTNRLPPWLLSRRSLHDVNNALMRLSIQHSVNFHTLLVQNHLHHSHFFAPYPVRSVCAPVAFSCLLVDLLKGALIFEDQDFGQLESFSSGRFYFHRALVFGGERQRRWSGGQSGSM